MNKTRNQAAGNILILIGVALLAAGIFLLLQPPQSYQATVRLKPATSLSSGSATNDLKAAPFGTDSFPTQTRRRNFRSRSDESLSDADAGWGQDDRAAILSKPILHQVITNLNLQHRWAEKSKSPADVEMVRTVQLLKERTEVTPASRTNLLEIRVASETESEAAEIADELARVFHKSRQPQDQKLDSGERQTLIQEWQKLTQRMQTVQDSLERLTVEQGALQPDSPLTDPVASEPSSNDSSAAANKRRAYAQARRELDALRLVRMRIYRQIARGTDPTSGTGALEIVGKAQTSAEPAFPNQTTARGALWLGGAVILAGAIWRRRVPPLNTTVPHVEGTGPTGAGPVS